MLKWIYRGRFWSNLSLFGEWKKPTVRDFLDHFFDFFIQNGPYTDLSKNGPHKKHCAWAPTPPWRKVEIYWILSIFSYFGAFNRAGKTVSKIGIYALPPSKIDFYGQFIKILAPEPFFIKFYNIYTQLVFKMFILNHWYCLSLFLLRR
jgi:hypothetical protein